MLDLAAESYTVVKRAAIEYLAPARGVLEASGCADPSQLELAKTNLMAGAAIEIEVPVSITDRDGSEVATVRFTIAIRPRRKANSEAS